jgi:UDP-N-acetylglucosamine--N-acetylmuramyl-(pentapeptide) pyrophosphoryl-undecaprenol N-acetylglucosamine transferase
MAENAQIDFYRIQSGKLRRYFSLKNLLDIFKICIGIIQGFFLLRKLKPDVVFSKGGFVAVPVGIAAKMNGIPLITHESDTTPGLATKILSRFAKHVLLGNPSLVKWTNKPSTFVGNPIRPELFQGSATRAIERYNLQPDEPVLFVSGGSSGAQVINDLIAHIAPELTKHMQIIHQTGPGKGRNLEIKSYTQREFLNGEEMADAITVASVIVGRAGANSISEFAAMEKPVIFIPLPRSSSRGDQIANAKVLSDAGAALTLDQDEINPDSLCQTIIDLINDPGSRRAMSEKIKFFARPNAADEIAKIILHA